MSDDKNLTDISAFFDRLRGTDRVRKSDKLTILSAPITNEERATRQKLSSLTQYVRNKNWNRRHIEYFEEYRRMVFTFPIIKAAIDIYGEEVCNTFDDGNIIKVKTENKRVKEELDKLFFENLKLNTRGRTIVRETCKFGNTYGYLVTRPGDGIVDMIFLPPDTILREEMYNNENLDNYRFTWYGGGSNSHYQPWEICHWRNVEDIESEPYGTSILRCIVDTWRRIVLMREALIIYRITRAPQKLLFKIDTDGMSGPEALAFANEVKKELKKKPLMNPKTGEIDFKYNVGSIQEDYFLPTYNGSASDITPIEGASNLDSIEDYKIIKDDLFAGLKIPKSFLTFEESLSNKAALSEEDVRFCKTTLRHQAQFIEGLLHIASVHLFLLGYSEEEIQSFVLEMNNPSLVSENKRLELAEKRINVAKAAWDSNNNGLNIMSYVDCLRIVLKLTDEEIQQTIRSQFVEKKIMWRMEQIRTTGTYADPEIDIKLAQKKGLTGGSEKSPTGFDGIMFEGKSLVTILKEKIDIELGELVKLVSAKPEKKKVQLLMSNKDSIMENLKQAKFDFQ